MVSRGSRGRGGVGFLGLRAPPHQLGGLGSAVSPAPAQIYFCPCSPVYYMVKSGDNKHWPS